MDQDEPTTPSGEEWRRAERFVAKLDETGDTPKSFLAKSLIGCTGLAAIAGFVVWILYRALFG